MNPPESNPDETEPAETDVYAIHGADPEVLAYAMAKYSRSSLSMRESLREINSQKAEQFLNTFYFAYGHRSIADLAHIPMAVERLSLLAAIHLVDEQRWDGQERSTRYQDFRRSGWYTPELGQHTALYTQTIQSLFDAYDQVSQGMLAALNDTVPCPPDMRRDTYERTLKARAFDVARYLLPLATNTSLGQIVNARTLETQASRLLTSPFYEIRVLGEKLRKAAIEPAWSLQQQAASELVDQREASEGGRDAVLEDLLLRPVRAAPTLVKYAAANAYQRETAKLLTRAVADLMAGQSIEDARRVDLLDDGEPLEVEIATSLLYPHTYYPYRQLRDHVASLTAEQRSEVIEMGTRDRGRHDELVRGFHAGSTLRFDIFMDIGGFRDMHRHRRCTQLLQCFTDRHGYEIPHAPGQPSLERAKVADVYRDAVDSALAAARTIQLTDRPEATESAQYCLPLATRCRAMFKMDFAEALYIAELRSGVGGHYSYRIVAWEMYQAVANRYPTLAHLFRVEDVNHPIDFLRR